VAAAKKLVSECPALCETACVDCLLHFRNSYYHQHLNRRTALDLLEQLGNNLDFTHDIPPRLPSPTGEEMQIPVNNPELTLRAMLERAGLHGYKPQHAINLGRPLGATVPDFFYEPRNDWYEGLCVYLDGMSGHLHGRPETRDKDRDVREELRNRGYEVV